MQVGSVTLLDVVAARERISEAIIRTPLVHSDLVSERAGWPVHLKLECLQRSGAFKLRGALSKLTSLAPEKRRNGFICPSTGNHGLAMAYAARIFKTRCVVVLPENSNPHKAALLRQLGAEVIEFGSGSDVRQQEADRLSRELGYTQVSPFSDPMVIAGQGTIGLEIIEDLHDVDEIYVPIGGGGLIAGIALAVKERMPKTRIYGVEPEHSDAMSQALRHSGPVSLAKVETVADGLAATRTEEINYLLVQRYVDDVILVSDREIIDATLFLIQNAKILAEPAAAASFAGMLANARRKGCAVAVISGGNISIDQIAEHKARFEI